MSTGTNTLGSAVLALASFVAQPQSFAADPIVISARGTALLPLTPERRLAAREAALVASLAILRQISEEELRIPSESADRFRYNCFREAFETFPGDKLALVERIEADELDAFHAYLQNIVDNWTTFILFLRKEPALLARVESLPMAQRNDLEELLTLLTPDDWHGPGKAGGRIVKAFERKYPRRTAQRKLEKLRALLALSEKQDVG